MAVVPGCGSRGAVVRCCTLLRHKTHGTETGDEVAVAYAWHPWGGQSVRVHEVIERTTGSVARCSLVGAIQVPVVGVPTATSAVLDVSGVGAGSYNVIAQFNTGIYCGNDVITLP